MSPQAARAPTTSAPPPLGPRPYRLSWSLRRVFVYTNAPQSPKLSSVSCTLQNSWVVPPAPSRQRPGTAVVLSSPPAAVAKRGFLAAHQTKPNPASASPRKHWKYVVVTPEGPRMCEAGEVPKANLRRIFVRTRASVVSTGHAEKGGLMGIGLRRSIATAKAGRKPKEEVTFASLHSSGRFSCLDRNDGRHPHIH